MQSSFGMMDASSMLRPGSGRSAVTANTLPTQNYTVFTGQQGSNMNSQAIVDKNGKLANYIQDHASKDVNSNPVESSLGNVDRMEIQGGVNLALFAPFKTTQNTGFHEKSKNTDIDEEGEPLKDKDPKAAETFEEKMAARMKSDEYVERRITTQKTGGKFS